MKHTDQGRRLIALLKERPMTYMEMNMLGISVSPQKRIKEQLLPGERVMTGADKAGRTTWRVVEVAYPEAA